MPPPSLKAWLSLKADGIETFARLIEQNIAQAGYLGALADDHPELERLAPVSLNIVNFRYRPVDAPEDGLDELNARILKAIQASGVAVPSSTFVYGKYAIRVAITNHRTRREDLDLLVAAVVEQGRSLL